MAQAGRSDLHSSWSERKRRKAVVDTHIQRHGYVCPGWDRPAHPAQDLTADHVIAHALVGHGATDLGVLCRSCNGRKGKRIDAPSHTPSVRSRDWFSD